jgi:hypothetical protein
MLNKSYIYLLILLCSNVFGQSIHIRDFTTIDGLPQIQVLSIKQDTDGYIWIGTKNGLSKFNGKSFKNYKFEDKKYKKSLVQNIAFKNNEIFVFSRKSIYKLQNDTLKLYWKCADDLDINMVSKNGDYVLANYSTGSYQLFDLDHKLIFTSKKDHGIYWYENDMICVDSNNTLLCIDILGNTHFSREERPRAYIVNGQMYFSFTNKKNETEVYNSKLDLQLRLNARNEISFINTSYKWNYVKTHDDKDFAIDTKNRRLHSIKNSNGIVCHDKDGNLWVNYEPGIHHIIFSPFDHLPYPIIKDVWTVEKLSSNQILFASLSNGLFSMPNLDANEKVTTINNFQNRYYFSSCKDSKGLTYLPTNMGVEIRNSRSNKIVANIDLKTAVLVSKHIKPINKVVVGGLASIFIFNNMEYEKIDLKDWTSSFIIDVEYKEDQLYLSTYNDVFLYSLKTKKVKPISLSEEDNGAASMCFDNRGNLWLGQVNRVLFYNFKNKARTLLAGTIKGSVTDINIIDKFIFIANSSELIVLDVNKFYDENKLAYKVFNKYSGLLCEEIAQHGMKMIDSLLVIPSSTYTAYTDINRLEIIENFLDLKITKIGPFFLSGNKEVIINNKEALIHFEAVGFNRPTHSENKAQ